VLAEEELFVLQRYANALQIQVRFFGFFCVVLQNANAFEIHCRSGREMAKALQCRAADC
jgi:hypothetical protein